MVSVVVVVVVVVVVFRVSRIGTKVGVEAFGLLFERHQLVLDAVGDELAPAAVVGAQVRRLRHQLRPVQKKKHTHKPKQRN